MKYFLAIAAGFWLLSAARAAGPRTLPKAEEAGKERTSEFREARHKRWKELQRLKKDLYYASAALDREALAEGKRDLSAYSKALLARIAELRRTGNIHPKLAGVLDRLERLARELPSLTYAEEYPRGLVKAIAHELRYAADESETEAELLSALDRRLVLPASQADEKGWLKEDVPVGEFIKQGTIKVFLAKHRIKRPKAHAKTSSAAILAGKHNVQVGVELLETVTHHSKFQIDGDYTFDFGALHIELTPEWRARNPSIARPVEGQKVRIRGWTYYDKFHKDEEEYDPEDPLMGINRATVWEVHPVLDISVVE